MLYYDTSKYNNPRFGRFGKKMQYRNIFSMALDIQIDLFGASNSYFGAYRSSFLPFYHRVENTKVETYRKITPDIQTGQ